MQGKVVAVTGAARGIGQAAVKAFAQAGATVVGLGRDPGRIEGAALALRCDVALWDEVEQAVADIVARFGRLDVLVNNAGVIEPIARLAEADPAAWGRAIDVNLTGVFHGMRAAIPVMRAQGSGTILTVGSGAAHTPLDGWSAYCAGKAGAAMLTRAAQLENPGLRIMSLSPGTVATDMQRQIGASGVDNRVSRMDFSEHIPADWPARALVWMCGPGAEDLAGQEISLRDEAIRRRIGL